MRVLAQNFKKYAPLEYKLQTSTVYLILALVRSYFKAQIVLTPLSFPKTWPFPSRGEFAESWASWVKAWRFTQESDSPEQGLTPFTPIHTSRNKGNGSAILLSATGVGQSISVQNKTSDYELVYVFVKSDFSYKEKKSLFPVELSQLVKNHIWNLWKKTNFIVFYFLTQCNVIALEVQVSFWYTFLQNVPSP